MPQPKERAKKIDWDLIRDSYINGDRDLYFFCRENTACECDPTWLTLKAKAYSEDWQKLRTIRIQKDLIQAQGINQALNSEVVQVELTAREELLNANAAFMRHVTAAQELQHLASALTEKFKQALHLIDVTEMAATDPKGCIAALKIITEFQSQAIELERKAFGLSGIKIELTLNQDNDDDRANVERKMKLLKEMPQEELLKSYMDALKSAE